MTGQRRPRNAALVPSTLLTGLVSYWKFDEEGEADTRMDSHGTNHLEIESGLPFGIGVPSAPAVIDNGADFQAEHSLFCANNASLQAGNIDFTFAGWLIVHAFGNGFVFQKEGEYALATETVLFVGDQIKFIVTVDGGGNETVVLDSGLAVETPLFVIAEYVSASARARLYLNNGFPVTVTTGALAAPGASDFIFGDRSGGNRPLNAIADEWGFWKRLLTPEEKAALYNDGAGLSYPFSQFGGEGLAPGGGGGGGKD